MDLCDWVPACLLKFALFRLCLLRAFGCSLSCDCCYTRLYGIQCLSMVRVKRLAYVQCV